MKKTTLLLVLSLVVNAAFAAILFLRPTSPANRADSATSPPDKPISSPAGNLTTAQLAALESGDATQLKAAGLSDKLVSMLTVGRAYAKLRTGMHELKQSAYSRSQYWRRPNLGADELRQMTKTQREFNETLDAAFNQDATLSSDSQYAFLPPEKRDVLRRIKHDYDEITSDLSAEMGGTQLPSDRKKLKILSDEKDRDIAAALTPEEYEQYNLHFSPTAATIRARYGDAIQTEDDYKKIFVLQKAYDDQSQLEFMAGPVSQEVMAMRHTAEVKLQDDIKAALGPDNYAVLQKASDPDYNALTSVVKRLNLSPQTADTVFASRDTYAAASQRINADPSLSAADRRTQLATLATQAQTDLTKMLGSEGAEAYAARANWMAMLKRGSAFSTNPKDAAPGMTNVGSSIYSVPPPRPAAPATPIK